MSTIYTKEYRISKSVNRTSKFENRFANDGFQDCSDLIDMSTDIMQSVFTGMIL